MATIEARITKVERNDDNGWTTITTDHDAVNELRTRIDAKAKEAGRLKVSGETLLIKYSHKPRTDDNGRVWDNYYYEGAATMPSASNGGSADDGIDRVTTPAATGRKTDPADAWRMSLAVGIKAAVASSPPGLDFPTQSKLALAWGTFAYTTPPPGNAQPADVQTASSGLPSYGDEEFVEDIPF